MQTEVLIIGGGLSGLHTAYECHKRGIKYLLLEARDRLGGRVLSLNKDEQSYDSRQAGVDLGPSWFWPQQQRINSLISELDLKNDVFFQNCNGDALYEDNQGNIQRGIDGISMAGAYRLRGGIRQLTNALSSQLSRETLFTNAVVKSVNYADGEITTMYETNNSIKHILSKQVVMALPPRVALQQINFEPAFTESRTHELNQIATWMAGHAKVVCIYKLRFWQDNGYSGDVISHRGPLQEIHDASSEDGGLNALFGFVGVPPVHRKHRQDELKKMAVAQLARIFGDQALEPLAVYFQDWSTEPCTSTQLDQEIQRFHPANNIGSVTEQSWDNRLIWSGTEAANYSLQNNGLLEGALEASMNAVSMLK
tara:strand:+ start:6584 stop:7684 length:1101 start_codon:yes stop_codon:yes gene_type:complete